MTSYILTTILSFLFGFSIAFVFNVKLITVGFHKSQRLRLMMMTYFCVNYPHEYDLVFSEDESGSSKKPL